MEKAGTLKKNIRLSIRYVIDTAIKNHQNPYEATHLIAILLTNE
jgi:hypothetical protein